MGSSGVKRILDLIFEEIRMPFTDLSPARHVAFLGLGVMGAPMAAHLLRAGLHVTVFNRTAAKAQAWVQAQREAQPLAQCACAASPQEAVRQAAVVLSCIGNDDDLHAMAYGPHGVLAGLQAGAIWVDHTTTSATIAREMAAAAQAVQADFVDAPVSGGQMGAEKGQLSVMCGGRADAFEHIKTVVSCYAKAVTYLGESGAGQLSKMVNQIAIAGLVQGLSEALAFGEKAGLDMHKVLGVISQGAAQSWQMDNRGHTMIDRQFDFGFALDWMRKDLGLVLDEARRNGARVPVAALVDQFYADLQAVNGGRWDTSSLIKRLVDQ
jgi:3-hydroxyisobutyrate dehydrogenase